MSLEFVYVFQSAGARFPGGTFRSLETAEEWIGKNKLLGLLTAYPLDIGVLEWAKEKGFFTPKKEHHNTPKFIGGFTSASMEHYHYENGEKHA